MALKLAVRHSSNKIAVIYKLKREVSVKVL